MGLFLTRNLREFGNAGALEITLEKKAGIAFRFDADWQNGIWVYLRRDNTGDPELDLELLYSETNYVELGPDIWVIPQARPKYRLWPGTYVVVALHQQGGPDPELDWFPNELADLGPAIRPWRPYGLPTKIIGSNDDSSNGDGDADFDDAMLGIIEE